MKKLVVLLIALAALAVVASATAHPLGNFTINRYSELHVSGDRLFVRYVLDMAEIPTFQASQRGGVDAHAYARRIAANLELKVNGRPARLTPLRQALAFPQGQGGLRTTRLEVVLAGPQIDGRTTVAYRDRNYADRLGWKEIVAQTDAGARITGSSVPARSVSQQLRVYPKDLLQEPLNVTSARLQARPGAAAGVAPALSTGNSLQAPDRTSDSGFSSLIHQGELSALVILGSLGIAFFWGLVHALSPGHGKAIITAYLVGQRGTPRHAAYLGAIVTVTHTIGVFALGAVTLLLSEFIVPDQLYPWLNLVSAILVVAIGASVFLARFRGRRTLMAHAHHHHARGHDHGHDHSGEHGHSHGHVHSHGGRTLSHVPDQPGWRGLLAVGVSGGLIPCPSALVVLLAAISLHRVAFGLLLIVAFSMGLALTITGVGLLAVLAKRVFNRVSFEGRLVRLLPATSALVIFAVGLVMTAKALPNVA
jgi:ABC-type nickel/cobalt efflux system permease component RcnA